MIISFLGHRSLYNCKDLLEKVKKTIIENADFNDDITFFAGDMVILMICVLVLVGR